MIDRQLIGVGPVEDTRSQHVSDVELTVREETWNRAPPCIGIVD